MERHHPYFVDVSWCHLTLNYRIPTLKQENHWPIMVKRKTWSIRVFCHQFLDDMSKAFWTVSGFLSVTVKVTPSHIQNQWDVIHVRWTINISLSVKLWYCLISVLYITDFIVISDLISELCATVNPFHFQHRNNFQDFYGVRRTKKSMLPSCFLLHTSCLHGTLRKKSLS